MSTVIALKAGFPREFNAKAQRHEDAKGRISDFNPFIIRSNKFLQLMFLDYLKKHPSINRRVNTPNSSLCAFVLNSQLEAQYRLFRAELAELSITAAKHVTNSKEESPLFKEEFFNSLGKPTPLKLLLI